MICPNCGNETNGKFCPRCGTKMPEAAPIEPVVPPVPEAPAMQTPPPVTQIPVQEPIQNPGYAPNPQVPYGAAPQPGYAPPPQNAVPNQSYANVPGYVPVQGSNPGQPLNTGAVNPNLLDPGDSPARRLIRKLASSPLYLFSVLLFTAGLVLSAIPYVKELIVFFEHFDYYKGDAEAWGTVAAYVGSILVTLLIAIALWSIFFAAIRKNPVRMRTGGLTAIKVYLTIGLICLILGLLAIVGLTIYVAVAADSEFLNQIRDRLLDLLRQYNYTYEETASLPFKTLLIILGCAGFVSFLIVTIFFGKLIKTVNTVKRVVRIGHPDDRVSPFAAVLCILIGLGDIYPAIDALIKGGDLLLSGVAMLCSALCIFLFGILIFQYRGGMRKLGVYRGVSTPNPNR